MPVSAATAGAPGLEAEASANSMGRCSGAHRRRGGAAKPGRGGGRLRMGEDLVVRLVGGDEGDQDGGARRPPRRGATGAVGKTSVGETHARSGAMVATPAGDSPAPMTGITLCDPSSPSEGTDHAVRLDRFTERSQEALQAAQQAAQSLQHPSVDPEHLLLALLEQPEGLVPGMLRRIEVQPEPLSARLRSTLDVASQADRRRRARGRPRAPHRADGRVRRDGAGSRTSTSPPSTSSSPSPPRTRARRRGCSRPPASPASGSTRPSRRCAAPSASPTPTRRPSTRRSPSTAATSPTPPAPGKLDPVIGRDTRSAGSVQVLSRRTKNNPVLIGEPGVGKTAIAEGLAQRIVARRHPRGPEGQARGRARPRRAWSRGASTAASSRTGSRRCSRRSPTATARSSSSSTSSTPWSARAPPRGRWTPATCSSRRSRGASCAASAPPPSTSTASTSRRTPRSSAASSR